MRIAVVAPRGRMGREVVRLLEQAGTELSIVDDKIEELSLIHTPSPRDQRGSRMPSSA